MITITYAGIHKHMKFLYEADYQDHLFGFLLRNLPFLLLCKPFTSAHRMENLTLGTLLKFNMKKCNSNMSCIGYG